MTVVSLRKSTIVRSTHQGLPVVFTLLERLAPAVGARWADRIWFSLPARTAEPATPPPAGRPFEVSTQGRAVRGIRWGDGPVVYLVHGWGGELGQLGAFVAPLVASGHRVVAFDGPSHGRSDPGPSGPRTSNAVELGRALDAVAARFGQPAAVIAHSMGAMSTVLALRDGWLNAPRLAVIAPMTELASYFDALQASLRFGPRTRDRLDADVERRVGYRVEDFDLRVVAGGIDRPDLLVVHDEGDRNTSYAASVALVESWPGARLRTTRGLGHRRVLSDPDVVRDVVAFVTVREATVPSDLMG